MNPTNRSSRSEIMARVRSRGNRSTEQRAEEALIESGFTGWVKHADLPGKPDFFFPAHHLLIFVDGCFWHGCPQHLRLPKSNADYWRAKIDGNRRRDNRIRRRLRQDGYHVMRVWEHDLKNDTWLKRLNSMLRRYS